MDLNKPPDETPSGFNALVAEFYKAALSAEPLEACAKTLARIVPGPLHLAFLTCRSGEIHFATNAGEQGRDFLMQTMGAADSHPLIYQTRGEVHAISDVLTQDDWRHRAMYQAARPFLPMEDALGTDIPLNHEWMLSTCAIRDTPAFSSGERDLFALLIPHLRTIFELDLHRGKSARAERLHRIALPPLFSLGPHRAALRVADEIRALFPFVRPEANALAARVASWVERHHPGAISAAAPLAAPAVFRDPAGTGGIAVCLPPATSLGGSVLLRVAAPAETSGLLRLTPRELEIGHWLSQGKTNDEIALILGISPRTAKRHLENIYEKLGVPNRASAIRLLIEEG